MRLSSTIGDIERDLRSLGSPVRAAGEKRYLKSELEFIGVSVPAVRRLALRWLRERPDLDHESLLRLVEALWSRRVHELRSFAIELLVARRDLLTSPDLGLIESMLRSCRTWAHVDPLAVHVVGTLVDRDPDLVSVLDRWVKDEDLWIRRSVLLAHLLPLRRGEGEWQRFVRYSDRIIDEREFFIRKALGWVLREAGKATPKRVAEYLDARIDRISGVSLREAVKHLSAEDRQRLSARFKSR